MTLELNPVGVTCNLDCGYCYQHPMRDAGNFGGTYDVDAMIEAAQRVGGEFSLFGGEALLIAKHHAEQIFAAGLEQSKTKDNPEGKNGVQTNGTLIDEEWIDLFERYRVSVGISVDGPGELNRSRFKTDIETTDRMTAQTHAAIDRLLERGLTPSLIVTLYRGNALPERRPQLKAWFKELDRKGVSSVRLHTLEVDDPRIGTRWALTPDQAIDALLDLATFEGTLERIRFDLFTDERNLLRGQDKHASCIWNACDPLTTIAVQGIDGEGRLTNCGRTNKDGVNKLKAERFGYERQLALHATPQEHGGCQGCRFFVACKGQCPGTGEGSDWRNRSDQCDLLKATFGHFESELIRAGEAPISVAADLPEIEACLLSHWADGVNLRLYEVLAHVREGKPLPGGRVEHGTSHGDDHGDHTDTTGDEHTDAPHSDVIVHTDSDSPTPRTVNGVAEVRS